MTLTARTVSDILTQAGIKPSAQRIAVMRYLLTHHTHPTVDEIYRDLLPEYPALSRTTVYNTVRLLVESGCVNHIGIDSANSRFDGATHPHAHFICQRCGAIHDVELTLLPQPPHGLSVNDTQVYFRGVCQNCQTTN